ncbi:MAG: class I SAM-dependent methyltransferase [Gammaproteobacteria bacterium]|nr:class I SAM-dependent methyltransferase [Gammaproteobacteria bacterium]
MSAIVSHDLPVGHLENCQVCGSTDLELIIDLGHHAPCDSLLAASQLNEAERVYPLRFLYCHTCTLAQIDYVVAPDELFFADYPYRSGITTTLKSYLQSTALPLIEKFGLTQGSFVIDLGSNDGTLLQGFLAQGMQVLGVEPTNIANIAIENGVPTMQAFFVLSTSEDIVKTHGHAQVVTAANMFAHVAKLGELLRGVEHVLDDDGIFLTESHYVMDLLDTVQYDSIYHEHLKYYSLRSIIKLFEHFNFTVVDAERIPNYGGSIRVFAQKGKDRPTRSRLGDLLEAEEEAGLYDVQTYHAFAEKVLQAKLDLQNLVLAAAREGKQVVGVGCPGRASTLVNYSNIDPVLMPYIAEQSTSLKLGMFLPGKHIPVVDEQRMFDESPEYALMLSWHYAEPIMKKLRAKGLKSQFVLPLPHVHIVDI